MSNFVTLRRIISQCLVREKGVAVGTQVVRYLVFDVESVADGNLVAKLRYPDRDLEPREAIDLYRQELLEQTNSDFIPYTFQVPVSVVIAKVSDDLRLLDLVALDEPEFRPHVIAEHFWRGWEAYRRPTWVTFNGRGFDLPLMELAAFRYGISVPGWFDVQAKGYQQRRNRYNTEAHFDLHDLLTNFGATRFHGGLNLAANLLGKPGKMAVQGYMVQDLFNDGQLAKINEYCRCDVLDTYFVFLRTCVLVGQLTLQREQELIAQTRQWLVDRRAENVAYADYLDSWGDWPNPWSGGRAGNGDANSENGTVESRPLKTSSRFD
jgi:predicted PolB exonuclease-like 3'-5' exonuclease